MEAIATDRREFKACPQAMTIGECFEIEYVPMNRGCRFHVDADCSHHLSFNRLTAEAGRLRESIIEMLEAAPDAVSDNHPE